jgi:hypothetical protein
MSTTTRKTCTATTCRTFHQARLTRTAATVQRGGTGRGGSRRNWHWDATRRRSGQQRATRWLRWPHGGGGKTAAEPAVRRAGKTDALAHAGGRPFISYLGTHPDDEEARSRWPRSGNTDEDRGSGHLPDHFARTRVAPHTGGQPRVSISSKPTEGGQPVRWVEVKSMTGSLENRPVGISRTQFDCARAKGDAYWLYVVEHATDPEKARVLRIQNPVGHARTFTFDKGWSQIARTEPPALSHPGRS